MKVILFLEAEVEVDIDADSEDDEAWMAAINAAFDQLREREILDAIELVGHDIVD